MLRVSAADLAEDRRPKPQAGFREIGQRVKELKRDIAANRYVVDSSAVAEAILSKRRLVRRGLASLDLNLGPELSEADRTQPRFEVRRVH